MKDNIIKFPKPKVDPWIEEGFTLVEEGIYDDRGELYIKEAQLIEDMHND